MVGFDTVAVADLDRDGTDEVIYIESPNGSGPVRESCALIVDRGRLRCWSGPDFRDASIGLNQGELLSRGWILSGGGPFAVPDTGPLIPGNGKSLWFYQPISREGDPLCCSSVHASLWLEALPVGGRFETGQILRSELDSMGKPLRTDTLHP
jgi:hypothetical protein